MMFPCSSGSDAAISTSGHFCSVWIYFSLSIHAFGQGSGNLCQSSRTLTAPIFRQREHLGLLSRQLLSLDTVASSANQTPRLHRQPSQGRPGPVTAVRLCGHPFDLSDGRAGPAQHRVQDLLDNPRAFSSSWAPQVVKWQQLPCGSHDFPRETYQAGQTTRALHTVCSLYESWDQSRDSCPFSRSSFPRKHSRLYSGGLR